MNTIKFAFCLIVLCLCLAFGIGFIIYGSGFHKLFGVVIIGLLLWGVISNNKRYDV